VNPVIAVALGVIFLKEKINLSYVLGGGVVILGVLLVVTNEGKRSKK
jgi:drug/metabolite transporter (DMT)-like permease